MSDDIHEVYAVCYATHSRKRSENYIFGDPHDEMTSISYYVWVIKGPHGVFVCDTGFDEVAAKERARRIIHPVGEGLKALGVQPDKVDHVIATHMHWDHESRKACNLHIALRIAFGHLNHAGCDHQRDRRCGPDGELPRRAEHRVAEPAQQVAVNADLRRQAGKRRIGERDRDRIGGQSNARYNVGG